jgi:outer membrane usher protein
MTVEKFIATLLMMFPACLIAERYEASSVRKVADFDVDLLRARGFPSEVAAYFRDRPHFFPGVQPVLIGINGLPAQSIEVNFNEQGLPCFDSDLWKRLRIRSERVPSGCLMPDRPLQNLHMELNPSRSSIELLVATTALLPNSDGFVRGGHAVVLNYDIQASQSQFRSGRWNYLSGRLQPGINVAGWTLRGNGYYSRYQGRTRYWNESAYVAKAIEPLSAVFQAGRFASNSTSWGGLPIMGIQITSDAAQAQQSSSSAVATGVVQTQAMVEIRQHGQLRYRTVLPPGPFELSSIPGVVPGIDMEVQIIEENGHRQTLRVPIPPGAAYAAQATSFQFGAGRYLPDYRARGNDRQSPGVLTMEWGAPLASHTSGSAGLLWAGAYRSAAISMNTNRPTGGRSAGLSLRASKARASGSGIEISANGSWALTEQIVASTSLLARSRRFATPEQGLWRTLGGSAHQRTSPSSRQRAITSSLTWTSSRWGTYGYSWSLSQPAAWLAPFRHALSANWKMKSSTWNLAAQHDGGRWQTIFFNVDIPWGAGRWQHSAQTSRTYRSVTTSYTNTLPNKHGSYRVHATQDNVGNRWMGAYTSLDNRFSNISSSVSVGSLSWSGNISASGGIAWTDRHPLFSPTPLADTFAVIRFPDLAGLRLRSPGGTTVTNKHGYALIPRLSPYQKQTASIDGRSIPITYRLTSSTLELSPARGSVVRQIVNASQVRQLILTVSMPDGRAASQGAAVLDRSGKLVSTVVGGGNIMLTNEQIGSMFRLKTAEGQICELDYQPPERFDPNRPYEESAATCG